MLSIEGNSQEMANLIWACARVNYYSPFIFNVLLEKNIDQVSERSERVLTFCA